MKIQTNSNILSFIKKKNQDIYEEASTTVRSLCKENENFTAKVVQIQVSALSSYLLSLVMNEITKRHTG